MHDEYDEEGEKAEGEGRGEVRGCETEEV